MNRKSSVPAATAEPRRSRPRSSAFLLAWLACVLPQFAAPASKAQTPRPVTSAPRGAQAANPARLVRRTTRRELRRTGYGSALSLLGAPAGNIVVEAWSRPEIEIVADIEMRADTEEDLARLAEVNTFAVDGDATRTSVVTLGTHDRKHLRRVTRDFPKRLLAAEWRIDYTVRVPAVYDLELYAGRGSVSVAGVEGALRVNLADGDLALRLAGGDVAATVARGRVLLQPLARSWRGRGVDLRLGAGEIDALLPAEFSADFDARILQAGQLDNAFGAPAPFDTSAPQAPAARTLRGRFGAGGAAFSLAVGSGDIRLRRAPGE